jgi:peptide/nickel transport system substrate-binding protein
VPNDSDVAQALGQMFARGGLTVNGVVTLPYNVFAPAATNLDYSVFLYSIGNSTSTSGPSLQNMLMTYDEEAGHGSFNRGRYSNPEFDRLLGAALSEFNDAKREDLLEQATRLAFGDSAVIPLYWQSVHWAGKASVDFTPSRGEDTVATNAHIAK